ncbi:MAG: radical SAM protein [Deltaproteobacteria bacterium]|nr:radical SAM protein [Deltaproteobacteria bacterium]
MIPNLGKLLILAKWLFTRLPTTVAVDITHRCNLRCRHCYWWKQDHPAELDDPGMISFLRGLREGGLCAAILYGGEPTLRPAICRAAGDIFHAVLAFTNGMNGFPEIRNVQWILSLDGPEDLNDAIRGKGVYRQAVENLKKAPAPPIVHMTISRLNQESVSEFVKEMLALPVKGIGFSFYTPDRTMDESGLFIPLNERDRLVMELLALRRQYGERVGFTPAMARQLLTTHDFFKWNSYADCPVSRRVRCFKANGERKACTYGNTADCSRCGCAAVAAYRGAFKPFDYRTLRLILGLMIPQLRVRKG